MPSYNRELWLAGIRQIRSIDKAISYYRREPREDPYLIHGELDEETKQYYATTWEVFERGVKEEVEGVVGDVITKLQNQPVEIVCKDSSSSRIIEHVCRTATQPQLLELLTIFKPQFTLLMHHLTTTFVVQTLLTSVSNFINLRDSILVEVFDEIVQSLKGTWSFNVVRIGASYVANLMFKILGNIPTQLTEAQKHKPSPHPSFGAALISISNEFLADKLRNRFHRFCASSNAARCIGSLTTALEASDEQLYVTMAQRCITNPRGEYWRIQSMMRSSEWIKSVIVPIFSSTSNPSVFHYYRLHFLQHNFMRLIKKQPKFREIVLAALRAIKGGEIPHEETKKVLKMMFMYMKMLLKYMKMQFFRVILDIGAKLTETHKTIFDGFYEVMCGDDALKFFSDLVFYSQYNSKVFSLYGTQVLKMLLGFEFQSKTLLLRSMYKAHPDLVARVACDKRGILDTMFTPDVPDLISNKLVNQLQNLIPKMVVSLHGSIFVIHLFERASMKYKKVIAKQLAPMIEIFPLLPFSKPLVDRVRVDLYRSDPSKWKKKIQKQQQQRIQQHPNNNNNTNTNNKLTFTEEQRREMIRSHEQLVQERKKVMEQQKEKEEEEEEAQEAGENNEESSNNSNKNGRMPNGQHNEEGHKNKRDNEGNENGHKKEGGERSHNKKEDGANRNGTKRKSDAEELAAKKRMRVAELLKSGPKFSNNPSTYGKYGKRTEHQGSQRRVKKEKKRYERRLKVQLAIEKRRIDKERVEATERAKKRLRAKSKHAEEKEVY